jgi:hypothetical protein
MSVALISLPVLSLAFLSLPSTTMPVTVREPRGTMTRAPIAGVGMPSGTEYVNKSSVGTGTATKMLFTCSAGLPSGTGAALLLPE